MKIKRPAADSRLQADWREDEEKKKEPVLKGTFASVLLLGAVIVVMWVGVFLLFISRN